MLRVEFVVTHRSYGGVVWDTQSFSETDLLVIEGLAQSYVRTICAKSAARFPGALHAFNTLCDIQPAVYTDFLNWKRGHDRLGEAARLAMVEARRNGVRDYHRFRDFVEQSHV